MLPFQAPYERMGDVPNIAFPCVSLPASQTGRLTIYYAGADTVICLAFAYRDELIDFVKSYSKLESVCASLP